MAKATGISSTKLSELIHNPTVRDAFQRAERDYGRDFDEWGDLDDESAPVETDRPRGLQGGAAEHVRELEFA